jgi:hypothetical protein
MHLEEHMYKLFGFSVVDWYSLFGLIYLYMKIVVFYKNGCKSSLWNIYKLFQLISMINLHMIVYEYAYTIYMKTSPLYFLLDKYVWYAKK